MSVQGCSGQRPRAGGVSRERGARCSDHEPSRFVVACRSMSIGLRHGRSVGTLLLVGSACGAASHVPPPAAHDVHTVLVEVVGPTGEPLVDAEVEGLVDINPGPAASTCCIQERFASAETSDDGRATLSDAPFTFRGYHVRVSYRDWPSRWVTVESVSGSRGVVRVVLGPTREVSGRVE